MSKHIPKVEPVCYGCNGRMVAAPPAVVDGLPKKHRAHIVWLCKSSDCAWEWSNTGLPGVVQCSCGTFWGQVP